MFRVSQSSKYNLESMDTGILHYLSYRHAKVSRLTPLRIMQCGSDTEPSGGKVRRSWILREVDRKDDPAGSPSRSCIIAPFARRLSLPELRAEVLTAAPEHHDLQASDRHDLRLASKLCIVHQHFQATTSVTPDLG